MSNDELTNELLAALEGLLAKAEYKERTGVMEHEWGDEAGQQMDVNPVIQASRQVP